MSNLALNLHNTAAKYGDRTAIILDDVKLTYSQLDDFSRRMVTHLRALGVQPGDRVALMLPNLPTFPVIYYAVLRMGAVVVPMNPLFKAREIEYYLDDSGAKVIFAMPGEAQAAAAAKGVAYVEIGADAGLGLVMSNDPDGGDVTDRSDQDTAVILYTSGTTGRPKGAELTHANLVTNQAAVCETLLDLHHEDVFLGCLPMFHVFGMTCVLNTAVASGAAVSLIPRFEPVKALQIIERDKVTLFAGVPTMYGAMLAAYADNPVTTSSLRTCVSGGASLPVELLRKFEAALGCAILEGYGLSETSPVASFNHPHAERKPGSIGTSIRGVEMDLRAQDGAAVPEGEIGEIVIRGENLMKGYWKKPDATAEAIRDGWFYSGDLARRDEEGYYYIVDRSKDMIIRGGYNVYPREIEEVLYEHPAIAEAAVLGVPHPELGEEIAAYVVIAPGEQIDAETIRDFVKDRVAAYKYPREVHFLEELPKGATGKILKREIKKDA